MFDDNDDFKLTNEEAKKGRKNLTVGLLYFALAGVILVTGAHAIMLVLAQAPTYGEGNGLLYAFLNIIRVAFPVLVEVCAIVAGLGFIGSKWREGQKWVAGGVELTWFIFAAANMITFFRLERGLPLESWQNNWVNYGLPLSALVAGVLTYFLVRADPDHKRSDEEVAADEKIKMMRFAVRRDVMISPQMRAIEKQRAWLEVVQAMRTAGYTDAQIRFMLQDTPQLLIDADNNGQPDLLESGEESGSIRNTIQGMVDRITGRQDEPDEQPPTRLENGREPVQTSSQPLTGISARDVLTRIHDYNLESDDEKEMTREALNHLLTGKDAVDIANWLTPRYGHLTRLGILSRIKDLTDIIDGIKEQQALSKRMNGRP